LAGDSARRRHLREVAAEAHECQFIFSGILAFENQTAAAAKVWDRLVARNLPIDRRYVLGYVRYLVAKQDPDQARMVWQKAAALSDLADYQPSTAGGNGDFSQET
jgi:hypothetical protein